jgi:hypothetical protein
MSHLTRRLIVTCAALLAAALPIAADAGRQAERRPPPAREPQRQPTPPPERQAKPRQPARQAGERARPAPKPQARVVVRGPVFVGGYFYDPLYGPYPWWPRTGYPHWYVPIYDQRADLRVKVTPKDSAVYVDGFYAGLVDEFDGVFQALPLPPGGHRVLLYRPGYRSERFHLYLRRGSVFTLRAALEPLRPGERSELPPTYTRVPAPPRPGSYRVPVERWPTAGTAPDTGWSLPPRTAGLTVVVQPADAAIVIDGERWFTSDPGRLAADLSPGTHRVRVSSPGYVSGEVEVTLVEGEPQTVHVTLVPAT